VGHDDGVPTVPSVTTGATLPGARWRRWLARLTFLLALFAVAVVLAVAEWKSVVMFAIGLAAAVISVTAAFFVLSRRGVLRWLALAVFAAAPLAVVAVYAFASLLWVALVSAAAWLLAGVTARAALSEDPAQWRMPELPARPARHPYLIMNPRSGGGKVVRFDLARKAEALGAQVFLMDGPELVDVAAVARQAVADGADLLGVAGGDGTQALVAGVAAEHGLPFLVIAAGTRNHFALDLGLDRADPPAGLNALSDGVELLVDLGTINGHTFVNNVSFGAYAEVVQTPAYRDDKLGTTLDTLPDLLQGQRGTRFYAVAGDETIDRPQALLVGSNPYETGDIAGLGRRARLDRGVLGVVAVRVGSARQAVGLLRGRHSDGVRVLTAQTVTVTSNAEQIPVGIDGEAVSLPLPVHCAISAGALRVRVPRDRPGVPPPKPAISWSRLWQLALGRRGPRPATAPGGTRSAAASHRNTGKAALNQSTAQVAGQRNTSKQVPDAGRLRIGHRRGRPARARPGAVAANADLRRGTHDRLVGHQPAGARRGHRSDPRRAWPASGTAGGGLRHQLGPPALGAAVGAGPSDQLPVLGREAVPDGAVPRAAPARRGHRRPGAHRRTARLPAEIHLPALEPAAGRRPAGAAGDAAHRPGRPAAALLPDRVAGKHDALTWPYYHRPRSAGIAALGWGSIGACGSPASSRGSATWSPADREGSRVRVASVVSSVLARGPAGSPVPQVLYGPAAGSGECRRRVGRSTHSFGMMSLS